MIKKYEITIGLEQIISQITLIVKILKQYYIYSYFLFFFGNSGYLQFSLLKNKKNLKG